MAEYSPGRASMIEQVEFLCGSSIRIPLKQPLVGRPGLGNLPGQGNTGPGSTIYNPGYQRYLDAHTVGSPAPLPYTSWLVADQPEKPIADVGEDGG